MNWDDALVAATRGIAIGVIIPLIALIIIKLMLWVFP